jgi:branched-chain amino acid aminotransferase
VSSLSVGHRAPVSPITGDRPLRTWVDGSLVDEQHARVSAYDHGLTAGDSVFETLTVVDGQAFALTRHLRRLARSAARLGLRAPDLSRARLRIALGPLSTWAPTVDVVTVPWTRNERGPVAGVKTTSYADNVAALAYARARRGRGDPGHHHR